MRYNPDDVTFPEGLYDAELSAVEKTSKGGNQMIVVTAKVYSGEKSQLVNDYFVEGLQSSLTRLAKLSKVIGHKFESGDVKPEDIQGKNVKVFLKVHDDENYGKQNKISRYEPLSAVGDAKQTDGTVDDGIPF